MSQSTKANQEAIDSIIQHAYDTLRGYVVSDEIANYILIYLSQIVINLLYIWSDILLEHSGGGRKPKFIYQSGDGKWFEHLNTEIQEYWKAASVYSN